MTLDYSHEKHHLQCALTGCLSATVAFTRNEIELNTFFSLNFFFILRNYLLCSFSS